MTSFFVSSDTIFSLFSKKVPFYSRETKHQTCLLLYLQTVVADFNSNTLNYNQITIVQLTWSKLSQNQRVSRVNFAAGSSLRFASFHGLRSKFIHGGLSRGPGAFHLYLGEVCPAWHWSLLDLGFIIPAHRREPFFREPLFSCLLNQNDLRVSRTRVSTLFHFQAVTDPREYNFFFMEHCMPAWCMFDLESVYVVCQCMDPRTSIACRIQ